MQDNAPAWMKQGEEDCCALTGLNESLVVVAAKPDLCHYRSLLVIHLYADSPTATLLVVTFRCRRVAVNLRPPGAAGRVVNKKPRSGLPLGTLRRAKLASS